MPQSFRQRKRVPKPKDIVLAWRTLIASIPMDVFPEHGWRESLRGVPNYRIKSITREWDWCVDVYSGGYYVITVAGRQSEPCESLPSLVGYLCRMLEVKPKVKNG